MSRIDSELTFSHINITPQIQSASGFPQWLRVEGRKLESGIDIVPLGIDECQGRINCRGCSHLVSNTEGVITQILQYGNLSAALCSAHPDYPFVFFKFADRRVSN